MSCFNFTRGIARIGDNRIMDERPAAFPQLDPEDFYFDGPYLVFTAAYHRKRGYCCNSGCRHCPYREPEPAQPTTQS
jgi:hypothetical protein